MRRRRFWLGILAGSLLGYMATLAAFRAADHAMREASALSCAKYSDGADDQIAACYLRAGLPVPGDL